MRIRDIAPGQAAYADPAALHELSDAHHAARSGRFYLNLNAEARAEAGGACTLPVTLRADGSSVFDVTPAKDYRHPNPVPMVQPLTVERDGVSTIPSLIGEAAYNWAPAALASPVAVG